MVSGRSAADGARTGGYTVDEVARLTGATVRTIRWYQSVGLLPPPRRSGRVALYDDEHVARLESIRDLQAHGLTLTAIRRLLDQAPGNAASTALAFVKAAVAQTGDEGTETISADEAAARLGMAVDEVDPDLVEGMGMARVLEDGRWQVLVPPAFEAAAELARAGVPADKRVEVGQVLHEHAQAMARAVVDLFVEHLWRPSDHNADDPEAWRALTEAVERLRPLATAAVASFFGVALAREAEAAAERAFTPPPS
ncbi:MAG TPA: MerR family transcriptional regulator [Acidimicrobiales bacterium]|nr:MerR family transcriptional regulator [Acidimicrobiales bacterium]